MSSSIVFTRVDAFIEAGAGEAYHFTYKGEAYFAESWSTRNASGTDIYRDSDGTAANDIFDDEDADFNFEEVLERAREAFNKAWNEHVEPHLEAMQATFLKLANKAGWYEAECENFDSCEPGTTHWFPEQGTIIRVKVDTVGKVIGQDKDISVSRMRTGVATDDVIHEAHQVGVQFGNWMPIWLDVTDDIEEIQ